MTVPEWNSECLQGRLTSRITDGCLFTACGTGHLKVGEKTDSSQPLGCLYRDTETEHCFNIVSKELSMTDIHSLSTQRGILNPDWGKRNRESLLGEVISDLSLSLIKWDALLWQRSQRKGLSTKATKKQRSRES